MKNNFGKSSRCSAKLLDNRKYIKKSTHFAIQKFHFKHKLKQLAITLFIIYKINTLYKYMKSQFAIDFFTRSSMLKLKKKTK